MKVLFFYIAVFFFVVVLHMTPYKISEKFEAAWLGGNVTGSFSWWRHQMETFSALLAICAGNSPVPGEFPTQRPVTRSFDVYFDLSPNKRLRKQLWGWWFETQSRPLWRHRNVEIGLTPPIAGGRFKNTYELLNLLKPLKFSIHIFQCMGKIFCAVPFQIPHKIFNPFMEEYDYNTT